MRNLWRFVLSAALLASFEGCTSSKQASAPRDFDAMEAAGMLRNGFAVLLDAREPAPAGATARQTLDPMGGKEIFLPASEVSREGRVSLLLDTVPGDKTVLVYAESREKARLAAQALSSIDRKHAFGVLPSIEEWKSVRLPVRAR